MADLAIAQRIPACGRPVWQRRGGQPGNIAVIARGALRDRRHRENQHRCARRSRRVFTRSRAAQAAGVEVEDLKKQDVDRTLAQLVAHAEWRQRYERAADNPLQPVAPIRPMPRTAADAVDWLHPGDYPRALALYDQLARTYPDLVEAHSRSAWLRATCPDAQHRDGQLAVASATRACELTNWKDPGEWEVLAAAFAEAGDFASAVKWQQKVMAQAVRAANPKSRQERLELYLAGNAFRQK